MVTQPLNENDRINPGSVRLKSPLSLIPYKIPFLHIIPVSIKCVLVKRDQWISQAMLQTILKVQTFGLAGLLIQLPPKQSLVPLATEFFGFQFFIQRLNLNPYPLANAICSVQWSFPFLISWLPSASIKCVISRPVAHYDSV